MASSTDAWKGWFHGLMIPTRGYGRSWVVKATFAELLLLPCGEPKFRMDAAILLQPWIESETMKGT
jgi:hypothetical protein